ncbi:zinc finger BED domain-containing protein RICESLEEPER 3-like [Durio zibethinus]|uniref:Zinc finger BED domain-containing protein RICESLEEPER 3-like n=1 Tax=Durio zibethinus TaxID=66656 RepID=A0A6P5X3P4_DURZI|nr:zinc finger BED domain-containing protein RICESLEEPER 3-like [Durio zibethinus]
MVRDILAIPVSSIISGSTFNEKVLMDNPIFSGLDPQIIEAMICGREWLESPKEDDRVNLAPMQNRAKRKTVVKETYAVKSCKKGTTTWTEKVTLNNYLHIL